MPDSGCSGRIGPTEDFSEEILVFGKVVAPQGLRGAIKVRPFIDDLEAWARLPEWWLGWEKNGEWRSVRLSCCHVRGGLLIAELEGMADRDASEAVRGMWVGVPRHSAPPTEENEYYWADLIGLEVENLQGQPLGRVDGLIETPANAVLRIVDEAKNERLLPFVGAVVLEVDPSRRRIQVDWSLEWL